MKNRIKWPLDFNNSFIEEMYNRIKEDNKGSDKSKDRKPKEKSIIIDCFT